MGRVCPPYYGLQDAVAIIDKIATIDEKINELAIERETYVKDLKEQIKKIDNN